MKKVAIKLRTELFNQLDKLKDKEQYFFQVAEEKEQYVRNCVNAYNNKSDTKFKVMVTDGGFLIYPRPRIE